MRSLAHPRAGSLTSDPSLALPQLKALSGERPRSSPAAARAGKKSAPDDGHTTAPATHRFAAPASVDVTDHGQVTRLSPDAGREPAAALSPSAPAGAPSARSRTARGMNATKYQYARAAPHTLPANAPRASLTKENMEMEQRQMRDTNLDFYQTRVRQKYVDEAVQKKLYNQGIAMKRHERLARQRARTHERVSRELELGTPYLQTKAREAADQALEAERRSAAVPVFADVAAMQEQMAAANLSARKLTPSSRFAKPLSVKELALRAEKEAPSMEALMNPRNQVTDPLPPMDVLLATDARRTERWRVAAAATGQYEVDVPVP